MNKTRLQIVLIGFITCCAVIYSCEPIDLAETRETYLDLPATNFNYQGPDTTNNIATLGRVLFYDRNLSINNTLSCGSCHKQQFGFADNARFSRGFETKTGNRNSMPIQNLGLAFPNMFASSTFEASTSQPFTDPGFFFGEQLFWDGREHDLNTMVLKPIINHMEMGIIDMPALETKLNALPYYKDLVQKAFNKDQMSSQEIGTSLAAFISSIKTNNTKFDRFMRGAESLSPLENEGRTLFFTKYDCNSCHQVVTTNGYLTSGGTFANIGLDQEYGDMGRAKISGDPKDAGKFKIPSLRNVTFTAPYMHDGRFATLDEVVDHYSKGISNHPNLDNRLRGARGAARMMNISSHEKQAIIAFLNTLSDTAPLTDEKFANPFKLK